MPADVERSRRGPGGVGTFPKEFGAELLAQTQSRYSAAVEKRAAVGSFEQSAAELAPIQRNVLALLALDGPANITNLTALANAAGLRQTPTRQLSIAALRPHTEALIEAGLVHAAPEGFYVKRGVKHPALRDAHTRRR